MRILLTTALLIVSVPMGCRSVSPVVSKAISPSNSFWLSPQQIAESIDLANSGDVAAMKALYFHYGIATGDDVKADKWLERAAFAGDLQARGQIICIFQKRGNPNQKSKISTLRDQWAISIPC